MPLYHEEKNYLNAFREKLISQKAVSYEEILEITDKLEEMLEMNAVTIKIIDKLMINYDKLKQEIVQKES